MQSLNTCNLWQAVFMLNQISTLIQGDCIDPNIRFYECNKCSPIPNAQSPDRFDCDHIEPSRGPNECYYNGKFYHDGDVIPYSDAPTCDLSNCYCRNGDIHCHPGDTTYPIIHDSDTDCYYTYNWEQCDPTGYNCKSNSSSFRCHVDGAYYREGERFTPPTDRCKQCICSRSYRGCLTDRSICRPIVCPLELFNSAQVLAKCALVYRNRDDCCPIDIKCPSESEERMWLWRNAMHKQKDNYNDCNYGPIIRVAQGYTSSSSSNNNGKKVRMHCECSMGPYVTCYIEDSP